MDCIICAEPIDGVERLYTVSTCGHNDICSLCFLRLRSLQRNFACPSCKQDLEHIVCVTKEGTTFNEYEVWGDNLVGMDHMLDPKARMFFPTDYQKKKIEPLWNYTCTACTQTRRDIRGIKGHAAAEHNLMVCTLCSEFKQVFPSEQKLYNQKAYEKHLKTGDGDGSLGHPKCDFCSKRFYDSTALFQHLSKEHYTCFLCERAGVQFKYYSKYDDLEAHFRKDHFLCEEKSCLERKFVAFDNELDFVAHNREWHPSFQTRRNISVSFNIRRAQDNEESSAANERESTTNSSNNSARGRGGSGRGGSGRGDTSGTGGRVGGVGGTQFEGGLGGRAADGQWQVEFEPSLARDPRDPNRNMAASGVDISHSQGSGGNSGFGGLGGGASTSQQGRNSVEEDFPALPTASAGGDNTVLLANRWISIGGSGSNGNAARKQLQHQQHQQHAKIKTAAGGISVQRTRPVGANLNRETDFPVLMGSSSSVRPAAGHVAVRSRTGIASSILEDYNTKQPAKANGGSQLGSWAKVKVVKQGKKAGGISSTTVGAGGGNHFDDDLALALAASMGDQPSQKSESNGVSPGSVSPHKSSSSYSSSSSSAATISDASAFPALNADLSGRAAGGTTVTKSKPSGKGFGAKKAAIAGRAAASAGAGWGDAFKAVGAPASQAAKTSTTGFSLVKKVVKKTSSPSSSYSSSTVAAAPHGGDAYEGLTPLTRKGEDEEEYAPAPAASAPASALRMVPPPPPSLDADNFPSLGTGSSIANNIYPQGNMNMKDKVKGTTASTGKIGGWVKIGGAGDHSAIIEEEASRMAAAAAVASATTYSSSTSSISGGTAEDTAGDDVIGKANVSPLPPPPPSFTADEFPTLGGGKALGSSLKGSTKK